MTSTHVALLRGINVGKAKRIAMADLRALVESIGFADVRTLLNSGNVVFSSSSTRAAKTAAARIEEGISAKLGVSARVTVISAVELEAAVRENPLVAEATDHSRLLVSVLADPADRVHLLSLSKQRWTPEVLAVGTRVAYLWCPTGILDSKLGTAVGRALGTGVTARNWATVLKLHAMTSSEAGRGS